MKKGIIIVVVFIVLLLLGLWLFRDDSGVMQEAAQNGDQTQMTEGSESAELADGEYAVASQESEVVWSGNKPLIPGYEDAGTIMVENGVFEITDGAITDGEVVIDMTSIDVSSTGAGGGEARLENHLESDDFFSVATYPEATYQITGTTMTADGQQALQGDMTVKGNTAAVLLPYTIVEQDGELVFEGRATIDRTQFDVRFGSDSFFDNLGDNVISDTFDLEYELVLEADAMGGA